MSKEVIGDKKEVPFGMHKYFNKNILPQGIKNYRKRILKKTPNKQSEGELILFVYEGTGTIIINHESFLLKKGVSIWLGPFHNYTIIPDSGYVIELEEISTNSGAYMYILSCPYLKIKKMQVHQRPAVVSLNSEEQEYVMQIIEEVQSMKAIDNYYAGKRKFLLMMQFFGLLMTKSLDRKRNS